MKCPHCQREYANMIALKYRVMSVHRRRILQLAAKQRNKKKPQRPPQPKTTMTIYRSRLLSRPKPARHSVWAVSGGLPSLGKRR